MKSKLMTIVGLLAITISITLFYKYGRSYWYPFYIKVVGRSTISDTVTHYQDTALERVKKDFKSAGISFPPNELAFLAIKETNEFELWAKNQTNWALIKNYPIKAASGILGPKLREGDKQVPEGIYRVSWLNPNSSYHLSLKLNYPNEFDSIWAKKESRNEPGTNIFIHGKAVSIGCLAMGDAAIEELFILTDIVGKEQVRVIISPVDPRVKTLTNSDTSKEWISVLYRDITDAFLEIVDNTN